MKAHSVLDTIGHTPHIRINRLFGNTHQVWIKSERTNPGGSIKDRIALAMVEGGRARSGATLHVPMPTGSIAVTVVDPVFYDKEGKRLDA